MTDAIRADSERPGRSSRARSPRLVVALDGGGSRLDLVRGKAANLDLLAELGFRVPPAAAVTTTASRRFVASSADFIAERAISQYRSRLEGGHESRVPSAVVGVPEGSADMRPRP